jgi:hypothetical protein
MTMTKEVTHTALLCYTTGLGPCPASMQTLRENVVTETRVVTVPAGAVAAWPETTGSVVSNTAAWGEGALDFAPAPTAAAHHKRDVVSFHLMEADVDPMPTVPEIDFDYYPVEQGLAIAFSIGVGVPLVALMIGLAFAFFKRDKSDDSDYEYNEKPSSGAGPIRL